MTEQDKEFMRRAIELAQQGIDGGQGGPFGAIVVRDGEIIGEGCNRVTSTNDPTAHAEVVAIRAACKNLNSFQLDGCVIYTSCEPCPMCCGAIINSEIGTLVIGARFHKMRRFSEVFGAYHDYSVEAMARLTGSRLQVISGVLETRCEALYRGARITVNG